MLVEYKSDYQKIAMGLLSYVPDLKDMSRLQSELDWYEQEEGRKLFLWKSEETGDMAGILGIEDNEELVLLRHISINPSYREEGMAYRMLDALAEKVTPKKVTGTIETGALITKWQKYNAERKVSNETSTIEEE
jgi:riboflavin biosynthesis RibT protein